MERYRVAPCQPLSLLILLAASLQAAERGSERANFSDDVRQLCDKYLAGFGSAATELVYHHRLNGPRGIAALASPQEIAAGTVAGRPMPYGYGSGIQDVPLENGQFLWALCDAYDRVPTTWIAEHARRLFRGFRRIAGLSPDPGFVPRGPHPDGKSYYRDSSRDQHMALVEALWRFGESPLAGDEDKRFIAGKLEQVARRMERYGWQITVEDGSRQAHVGFGWTQYTPIGASTLLPFLAMVHDATGDAHWDDFYRRFSDEKQGVRWTTHLDPGRADAWPPLTLYSNQFSQSLAALARVERDASRRRQACELLRRQAHRALRGNVFDSREWRRLDWAGMQSDGATEELLRPLGLSLRRPATVFDVYRAFRIEQWKADDTAIRAVRAKLCFGLPTSAFHTALLSGDGVVVAQVAPSVRQMIGQMLAGGDLYQQGENFNRTVILGLLLLANEPARGQQP